jgi:uncharacterized zinc-type alcohol dehydrogenase-like protein
MSTKAYATLGAADSLAPFSLSRRGPLAVAAFSLIFKRRQFARSLIGGIAETQEMLDFCGTHGITSDIEMIAIQKVNEAYGGLLRSDVKYRFAIGMVSLKNG